MGASTAIEWTDHTFNPWWGCTRVSPGCQHCYAETFSKRVGLTVWGPTAGRRFFGDKHWAEPLKWERAAAKEGRRHRVFCASMADVFEDRADLIPHRARLFDLINRTDWLDWQILTKRPEHVMRLVPEHWHSYGFPPQVWIGATAEDQERADQRIPVLLGMPARIRFVSCEPLLGPVTFRWAAWQPISAVAPTNHIDGLRRLDWIIVGGESGPGARPFDIAWAHAIVNQCREAGVPCFVKQLGARPFFGGTDCGDLNRNFGARGISLRDRKGGDWNEWDDQLRVRQFPGNA
jgi:protein gp37